MGYEFSEFKVPAKMEFNLLSHQQIVRMYFLVTNNPKTPYKREHSKGKRDRLKRESHEQCEIYLLDGYLRGD